MRKQYNLSCVLFSSLFAIFLFSGCSGDSSEEFFADFSGIWEVQYNLVSDGCGLAIEGIPGIFDQHTIEQTGRDVVLSARSGLVEGAIGEVRDDNSMLVRQSFEGDFFGTGANCLLETTISYQEPEADQASTLFDQSINCDDGNSCETSAVGSAQLQDGQ